MHDHHDPGSGAWPPVRNEHGMTTAEYAVGTVSACGFAGLLYTLLTSGFGQQLLESILGKITDQLPF